MVNLEDITNAESKRLEEDVKSLTRFWYANRLCTYLFGSATVAVAGVGAYGLAVSDYGLPIFGTIPAIYNAILCYKTNREGKKVKEDLKKATITKELKTINERLDDSLRKLENEK